MPHYNTSPLPNFLPTFYANEMDVDKPNRFFLAIDVDCDLARTNIWHLSQLKVWKASFFIIQM